MSGSACAFWKISPPPPGPLTAITDASVDWPLEMRARTGRCVFRAETAWRCERDVSQTETVDESTWRCERDVFQTETEHETTWRRERDVSQTETVDESAWRCERDVSQMETVDTSPPGDVSVMCPRRKLWTRVRLEM